MVLANKTFFKTKWTFVRMETFTGRLVIKNIEINQFMFPAEIEI